MINDLNGNALQFANCCVECCTVNDLVLFVRNGINHDMCKQFDITGEQWNDSILAALEVLRKKP